MVVGQVPNALIVNPNNIAATTVAEFIAYLKANPGKATSATQGIGTTSHLTSEMLQMMAQVKVQHIPYRGSPPALQELLADDVDFMFSNLGISLPLIQRTQLPFSTIASA